MSFEDRFALTGLAIYFMIFIALFIGWVHNLIDFLGMVGDPITGWWIARLVGIFALPLGGILGWL